MTSVCFFLSHEPPTKSLSKQNIDKEEGAVKSIRGNKGRIAQTWVNGREGMRVFAVYFWHSKGLTQRNESLMEAVVQLTRHSRYLLVMTCDANMDPEDFRKSWWFKERCMITEAPEEGTSTFRSTSPEDTKQLNGRMMASLLAKVCMERSRISKQWKTSSQEHARVLLSWLKEKRDSGSASV